MLKAKITILSIFWASVGTITAQERMIVHLKDGTKATYEMSQVDYVELEAPEGSAVAKTDTVQGIGGTVASTVDLGTSTKWATHNVGASSMSNAGGRFSFEDANNAVTAWGEGWRLPTEADFQELYEKCTWEWVTIDGVGGRLVKGTNGNTVFFPASGLSIEDKLHVVGSLGIYWTSKTSSTDAKNSVGAYFDSANIYRMEFPKTNTFSVRLVKDEVK